MGAAAATSVLNAVARYLQAKDTASVLAGLQKPLLDSAGVTAAYNRDDSHYGPAAGSLELGGQPAVGPDTSIAQHVHNVTNNLSHLLRDASVTLIAPEVCTYDGAWFVAGVIPQWAARGWVGRTWSMSAHLVRGDLARCR